MRKAYGLTCLRLPRRSDAFKTSKWMEQYARARLMEQHTVTEDEFHQFRVLGVGGFGAVHAAVKKDTGYVHEKPCALTRNRSTFRLNQSQSKPITFRLNQSQCRVRG